MQGKVYLIRVRDNKVVPALILSCNENEIYAAQIKKLSRERNNDVIYIGKPEGLNSESIVMPYKIHRICQKNLIRQLAAVEYKKVQETIDIANKLENKKVLHEKLHVIKKKIALAQINNEEYKELQKELDSILKELNYEVTNSENKRAYGGFREVPNRGFVKIYYGGR